MPRLSRMILKAAQWRVEGSLPQSSRFVVIAAPHTSNWDFPFMLLISFAMEMKVNWMGKDAIFRKPFRGLFKWLGGIPIDRSRSNNVVGQSIETLTHLDNLALVVPPSGTRQRVTRWKTGFYHIAHGAKVPIALGFLDYQRKAGGIGPHLIPRGDLAADMEIISKFYARVTGKHPENAILPSHVNNKTP
ncbi:1-acyl-sn-glycerol-3-phosphate acyltransferase [Desulfocicer vacuolatum]|nr:1-acyl-sn-glycerol-3-phosphate acyltransferase [Desulfocicer vacuolatum]